MKVTLLGIVPLLFASTAWGDDRDPRPAIWERFRSRQTAGETADIAWTKHRLRTGAAALRHPRPLGPDEAPPPDFVFPPHRGRLAVSGDRVRYENVVPTGVATDGRGGVRTLEQPDLAESIAAFDGTRQQSFTGPTSQSGPNGRLHRRKQFNEWRNIHLLPVFLAVRPQREEFGH